MSKQPERKKVSGERSPEAYLQSLLSRGVWTKAVVLRKLQGRGIPEEEAELLIGKYEDAGFFDDGAYALLFVESHPEWGLYRLRDELRRRGVPKEHILRALEETDEEENATALAGEWIRMGIDRRKIGERLLRRGFSRNACTNALERACEGEL